MGGSTWVRSQRRGRRQPPPEGAIGGQAGCRSPCKRQMRRSLFRPYAERSQFLQVTGHNLAVRDVPLCRRGNAMTRKTRSPHDELRSEYRFDYSKAVRGKYYRRLLKEGANVVVPEPDIAKVFQDSAAVNDALRSLFEVTRSTRRLATRSSRPARKHPADSGRQVTPPVSAGGPRGAVATEPQAAVLRLL